MEESATMMSPLFSDALNFLALGISVVLLFAVAYLWSSNGAKTKELSRIQEDLKKLKRTVTKVEEKVSELREPTVVAQVPQIDAFGVGAAAVSANNATLTPQSLWSNFIDEYNDLAEEMSLPGQLKKCERFIRDNKLKILTYGGSMTFRHAIDAKDSGYWAFKCKGDEYAVVPNPMKPCDEELHEHGGIKEIFALNYADGVYRRYSVKLPAIFSHDPNRGWVLKNPGVANLERK